MNVITYQIYLEQPLLATQLAGDPNSSVSFNYIPGSLVRGLLVQRHLKQQGINPRTTNIFEDTKHAACSTLFFSESVRFLHAYPLTDGKTRTLPTPRSLLVYKDANTDAGADLTVFNASHSEWNEVERYERECVDALKPMATPFCWGESNNLACYKLPPNRIAVHVFRKRSVGRATRDEGTVFRYEALAAGQTFSGVILTDDEAQAKTLVQLLERSETAWLGRSRSANYGKVRLNHVAQSATWREHPGQTLTDAAPDSRLRLTLLSDTMMRNKEGQYVGRLDNDTLSRYLGFQVELEYNHTLTAPALLGGYNVAAQSPLRQTLALAAGSVIVCKPKDEVSAQRLSELEQQGLGERRNEGYGRIACMWELDIEVKTHVLRLDSDQHVAQPGTAAITSAAGRNLAQRIANRTQQQEIDRHIVAFVHKHINPRAVERFPPNSQLGRVRVLVRRAQVNKNLDDVQRGLKSFKDVGRGHFERTPFRDGTLWEWLQRMTTRPEQVWEELGMQNVPGALGISATRDSTSAVKTTLDLLEAVLRQPARLRRAEEVR